MNTSMVSPQSFIVGAGPIFRQMADRIGLVKTVNEMLPWDADQCRISPGERVLVLLLDILLGKSPLYRLAERWTATDVAVLIGAGRQPADFSDDSLGRALDKFAQAGAAKVFSTVALQAYAAESVDFSVVHWDSTSRSVYGDYTKAQSATVHPTYGYSKDGRPDLKQIILTLLVNREGVPRFGTVASGNASDKALNGQMVETLTSSLAPTQLQHLIYVADSALVTGPNLQRLAMQNLAFISRCPETFRAAKTVKKAAWADNQWQSIGVLAERRNAAHYWASEHEILINEIPYRLVAYRSNTPDRRRIQALDREIQRERDRLEMFVHKTQTYRFACEADAQHATQQWQREMAAQWHTITFAITHETVYRRPGRPRKHPEPEDFLTQWRISVTLGQGDATQRQQELERRSTFVLITTVPRARLSARALLAEYKGQTHVERHFHFLKDPLFVDALFVKKPERVEALGYVLLLACLLYSLVERRLRLSEIPIPSPSRRVLKRPTAHEVVRHLESLQVMHTPSGERVIALPTILHKTLETILQALDMSVSIFTVPPSRDPPTTQ